MSRLVKWLVVGAGVIGAWCILAVMVVMAIEVFCRYFLGNPTYWALEVSTYLLAASVALGGAYTLRENAHVGVELLFNAMSPQLKAASRTIGLLTVLGFSVVLVWYGIEEVHTAIRFGEVSLTPLAMPLAYPLSLIPIGGVLLIIQAVELLLNPSPEPVSHPPLESERPGSIPS